MSALVCIGAFKVWHFGIGLHSTTPKLLELIGLSLISLSNVKLKHCFNALKDFLRDLGCANAVVNIPVRRSFKEVINGV